MFVECRRRVEAFLAALTLVTITGELHAKLLASVSPNIKVPENTINTQQIAARPA